MVGDSGVGRGGGAGSGEVEWFGLESGAGVVLPMGGIQGEKGKLGSGVPSSMACGLEGSEAGVQGDRGTPSSANGWVRIGSRVIRSDLIF